jgi:hypothetical protein
MLLTTVRDEVSKEPMKRFLTFVAVIFTAAVAWVVAAPAQTDVRTLPATGNPASISGPRINFASTEFDFGRIAQGTVVHHEFVFTNTGRATLVITDVRPGCGCTTAENWDKEVAPGKTGVIPLQFNSGSFNGKVAKPTTVTCNAEGQSSVVLHINATIWQPFQIQPPAAHFRTFSESPTNETKVVRIVSDLDEPVTLSDLLSTNDSFRTELKTIRPGKEFELLITACPPFDSVSPQTMVSLKTSSKEVPLINVMANASVVQLLTILPERILLPQGPLPAGRRTLITIRNNGENLLGVSDASVNAPGASVQLREAQPGRYFTLTVDFPPGFELRPDEKFEVTAKSNLPKYPLITVPVVPVQRPTAP